MSISINAHGITQEEANWLFSVAEDYLKQSDLASFLIDQLKQIPEVLTINVYATDPNSVGNQWVFPSDGSAGSVNWNVKRTLTATEDRAKQPDASNFEIFLSGFQSNKQEIISPALLLMHEMGHACQYMSGQEGDLERTLNEKGLLEVENINVNAIENTVASELNSKGNTEGIRWDYRDAEVS